MKRQDKVMSVFRDTRESSCTLTDTILVFDIDLLLQMRTMLC